METTLALSTFALAVFTAAMAYATFKLATESRRASFRQIGAQIWIEFGKRFDSADMVKARAQLARAIESYISSPDKHKEISETVINFFEDLGTAYRRGYVDADLTSDTFSYHVCRWWEALKAYVDYERKRHNEDNTLFTDFETLARTLRLPNEVIDADEMKLFLTDESNLIVG